MFNREISKETGVSIGNISGIINEGDHEVSPEDREFRFLAR